MLCRVTSSSPDATEYLLCIEADAHKFYRGSMSSRWLVEKLGKCNTTAQMSSPSLGRVRKRVSKGNFPRLEQCLVSWMRQCRGQNIPMGGPLLKEKAKAFAKELGIEFFDLTFDDYELVTTDIAVWGALSDAEIVALDHNNTESDEGKSEELTPVTLSEAEVSLNKLRNFSL
ncbi:hypothetical protein TNCV_3684671 [Trichonephila clavipes]|uniref:HTH CENPB-type domain-containing protein n=1 Tax=Trichonephila clavipes TaxID=2585209 RepID=A0A8X6RRZ8_TRICX|nr:hypothetical protein TNCV_3684671 [Trichonephila clavipes]